MALMQQIRAEVKCPGARAPTQNPQEPRPLNALSARKHVDRLLAVREFLLQAQWRAAPEEAAALRDQQCRIEHELVEHFWGPK